MGFLGVLLRVFVYGGIIWLVQRLFSGFGGWTDSD